MNSEEDPVKQLMSMMGIDSSKLEPKKTPSNSLNPQKNDEIDEKFWFSKGYAQSYKIGKTFAGLQNNGTPQEFLTKFCNMFQSYVRIRAEKSGQHIESELFDILRSVFFCLYKKCGEETDTQTEEIAQFLSMIHGFSKTYIENTKIKEKI